jgi:hypothetical protein
LYQSEMNKISKTFIFLPTDKILFCFCESSLSLPNKMQKIGQLFVFLENKKLN